jgi:hypothetical protein
LLARGGGGGGAGMVGSGSMPADDRAAGNAGEAGAGPQGELPEGTSGSSSSGSSSSGSSTGGSSTSGSSTGGSSTGGSSSDGSSSGGWSSGAAGAGGSSSGAAGAGGSSQPAHCAGGATLGPNGACYRVATTSARWVDARAACRNAGDGWDLASVLDQREAAFLSGMLMTEAWIGADDTNGTGVWRWVRDGAEFWQGGPAGSALNDAYVNWNADQPKDGSVRACLRISPSALWAAGDCGGGFPSVCEGPPD